MTAAVLSLAVGLIAAPAGALAARPGAHRHSARKAHRTDAHRHRPTHRHPKSTHRSPKPAGSRHDREKPARPRRYAGAGEVATAGVSQTAATIAVVLATPCQNTEVTPAAENLTVVREAVLCLINRERAEHDRAPLVPNGDLQQAAEGHAAELIADDYFAHVSPQGETPVDRIKGTGYIPGPSVGYVIGENLAWGTYSLSTPQSIVAAWIASPGHLANILEGRYVETGIAIFPAVPEALGEGNPGATYAEEFGVILH
jgi:uncharacterized protein YkwD